MKRRLLSFLLATVLIVSGLPQTGYAREIAQNGEAETAESTEIMAEDIEASVENDEELSAVTGEQIETGDEQTEVTDEQTEVVDEQIKVVDEQIKTDEEQVEVSGEEIEAMGEEIERGDKQTEVVDEQIEVIDEQTGVTDEQTEVPEILEDTTEADTYEGSLSDLIAQDIYKYTLNENGDAIITGCKGTDPDMIIIPSQMGGHTVVEIGEAAFKNSDVQTVYFPDTVTVIGKDAFNSCDELREVILPSGLEVLGDCAFANCDSLVAVTIPKSLKTATTPFEFSDALKRITFEQGTVYITDTLFRYCGGLEEVVIPGTVKCIGSFSFDNCEKLRKVTIQKGVETIQWHAFGDNPSLTSISIPVGVTTIEDSAFTQCTALKEVVLPDSLKKLDAYLFSDCTSLEKVVLPAKCESISYGVFWGCTSLKSFVWPETVDYISSWAFSESGLEELILPEHITVIETEAFSKCKNLKKVVLHDGVTQIDERAFMGCSALSSVKLSNSMTYLYEYTFYGCSSLTQVEIPYKVRTIAKQVFADCTSLKKVTIYPGTGDIFDNAFDGVTNATFVCTEKSRAYTYAQQHNFKTSLLVVEPTSMTLSSQEIYSYPTGHHDLKANVLPENQTYEVEWISSNPKVADYYSGRVIGVSTGTATLIAKVGNIFKQCKVTVLPHNIEKPEVTVSGANGKAVITWNAVEYAEQYVVQRFYGDQQNGEVVATVGATEKLKYVDTNVLGGSEYSYSVSAVFKNLDSGVRTPQKVTITPASPTTKLTLMETGVKVSWNEVPGAEGYYVYRKEPGKAYTKLTTVSGKRYYLDKSAEIGREYYYAVKAFAKGITGSYISANVKLILEAPTFTAKAMEDGTVQINWNTVLWGDSYTVSRKEEGKEYWPVIYSGNATSYTDNSATAGKKYTYSIRAYAERGKYIYSECNYVTVTVLPKTPTPKVTHSTNGERIAWDEIRGAEGYYVYRKVPGGSYTKIATVTGKTAYLDKTAVSGKQYYYAVKAYANGKVSGYKSVLTTVPKR